MPLLLIYWYRTTENPSTVISLDSTVVIPVDKPDKTLWNAHCFDVVHVREQSKETTATRTFTASLASRDTWVFHMNQVLLQHAKAKSQHQQLLKAQQLEKEKAAKKKQQKQNGWRNPTPDSIWSGDRFVEVTSSPPPPPPQPRSPPPPLSPRSLNARAKTVSPPTSPRSPSNKPCPLPRPDVLVGESLLPV